MKKLAEDGITSDKHNKNVFRFYHLQGCHPPFQNYEKQYIAKEIMLTRAESSLDIVFEYVRQLREKGLYDNTTIIVTADHGQNYLYIPGRKDLMVELGLDATSNPILMVKQADRPAEKIKYSKAPVSHKEVVAEIMYAVNPALTGYGDKLDDIKEDEARDRIFIFDRRDLPYVKVLITGDVMDADSWNILEEKPK